MTNKKKIIEEITTLKSLEDKKYEERLDQFLQLLQKAIELNQNIYW